MLNIINNVIYAFIVVVGPVVIMGSIFERFIKEEPVITKEE